MGRACACLPACLLARPSHPGGCLPLHTQHALDALPPPPTCARSYPLQVAKPSKAGQDGEMAKALWLKTEELLAAAAARAGQA